MKLLKSNLEAMTSNRVLSTAQKMKFSIKDVFSKCEEILCRIGNFIGLSFIDPKKVSIRTCERPVAEGIK